MENQEQLIKSEALTLVDAAKSITIVSDQDCVFASEFLVRCRQQRKKIDEFTKPVIEAAHQAHKAACNQKKTLEKPVQDAEQIVMPKITAYRQEQEKKRREEQERLRKEAEAAAQEKALQDAIEAEKLGAKEIVEEILAAPVQYVAPIVAAQPKMEGLSEREFWTFEVVNPDWIPKEYLIVDEKKISGVVKALKDKAQIPGVRVYCEKRLAVRTA